MKMTAKFFKKFNFSKHHGFSLQRVSIASLPRNIGNAGMVAGMIMQLAYFGVTEK